MMNGDHEWGALAPSNLQTMARNLAVQMPNNWLGQRINILMRQFTGAKLKRPYDVEVFGPMKARLHPYDNICEKRLLGTAILGLGRTISSFGFYKSIQKRRASIR